MNKTKYVITTPNGDRYELAENGGVIKYSNGLDKTNSDPKELESWKVLGIAELLPFGNLGKVTPLNEAVKLETTKFKNGKPKYTGVDLDHGTTRVWGNTEYHGVASIIKV